MARDSESWEAVRARLSLPMACIPASDAVDKSPHFGADVLHTDGATSGPTTILRAQAQTNALVVEIRRCAKAGDGSRLFKIVRDYPDIVLDSRVSDTLLSWMEKSRYRPGCGRPSGVYTFHPLVIYGLVSRLLVAAIVKNKEQAFTWLEEHQGPQRLSARRLYYEACSEPIFRGLLMEYPETSQSPRDVAFERLCADAEVLHPGQEIVRTLDGSGRLPMEVRFFGLNQSGK